MKTGSRKWLTGLLAVAASWLATDAQAALNAHLNIDVAITANLSVAVNGAQSSTMTTTWNTGTADFRAVSGATATVRIDSGAQTEKWALSTPGGSSNIDTPGGDVWTLDTTTDTLP